MANNESEHSGAGSDLGPLQISEIILRTQRYEVMRDWYRTLFGGMQPTMEATPRRRMKSIPEVERLCFLRIHMTYPFTQVLGIFEVEPGAPKARLAWGLDHMQFREATRENLFKRHAYLKERGILPTQTFNHGPGTSFYYEDPDGNTVEISAPNFHLESDYLEFFKSEQFRSNVEGNEVDAESYIEAVRGEEARLSRR